MNTADNNMPVTLLLALIQGLSNRKNLTSS